MSKFHISQVGRERIKSWHRANINKIANDPIIKEKYSDKIENLKDCLSSSSTNINITSEPIYKPAIKEVLSTITKDDVIVQKKKKKVTDITSLDSLEEKKSEDVTEKPREFPHPNHYYKQNEDKTKISAIRVITYNKSYERDSY